MFQKILVCSDGSPCALNAVRVGAKWAHQLRASALLLDVLDPGFWPSHDGENSSLSLAGTSLEGIACSQREAVQSGAMPVFAAAGIRVQSLSERGHPVSTIVETARREGCDLIVLGSHGQSGAGEFLLGSVSEGVMRHASCSVLTVPDSFGASDTPKSGPLLLASDGSASALRATLVAVELAAKIHSSLTIVNVYEEPGLLAETADAVAERYPQEQEQRVIQAIRQSMEEISQAAGVACTLRQEKGHTATAILRVAQEEKAGLIVVGHRGRGGFEAMLLGSVSGRVAQRAHCPVLVTR